MHTFIYTDIHICIYTHVYIYACICNVCMYVHRHASVCIHVWMYVYVCISIYACLHIYVICESIVQKTMIDTHLIFDTILYLCNTHTPNQTWDRHQYGYDLLAIFVKGFFAKRHNFFKFCSWPYIMIQFPS